MHDEGVVALLGLVLLQQENNEVRIHDEDVERGLPTNSGVQVYHDEATEELVIRIQSYDEEVKDENEL